MHVQFPADLITDGIRNYLFVCRSIHKKGMYKEYIIILKDGQIPAYGFNLTVCWLYIVNGNNYTAVLHDRIPHCHPLPVSVSAVYCFRHIFLSAFILPSVLRSSCPPFLYILNKLTGPHLRAFFIKVEFGIIEQIVRYEIIRKM